MRFARYVSAALLAASLSAAALATEDAPSPPNAKPASAIDALTSLGEQMRRARADHDWRSYESAAKRQSELLNGSPASRLEVARAAVHAQDLEAALAQARAFARMGQTSAFLDTSPELAPLRAGTDYAAVREQLAVNREPIAGSSMLFTLPDARVVPEDIDYDAAAERFYLSSVLERKIIAATRRGLMVDFAAAPDGWPILALKIDRKRQRLWASEVALQGFTGVAARDAGRSVILCYGLRTGQLLARIEGPRPTALGDMALMPDGTLIASDGDQGGLYRLGSDRQFVRLDAGDFISPQTPVILGQGERIIVPDYVRGLALLTLQGRKVRWFDSESRYALVGVDGLYRAAGRLLAVQNGTTPERVAVFSLNAAATRITDQRIIERGGALGVPTHGVVAGEYFYYIANSGWDALDEKGGVKAGATLSPARVMVVALSGATPAS